MISPPNDAVAVIGMDGRFPGAASVTQLWENIKAGEESLTRFTPEQLIASGISATESQHPDYVPVRGVLEDIDKFDAELFGYTPKEAEITDPQQRLLLECAWQTLETAGYPSGRVGVFAGTSMSQYLWRHLLASTELEEALGLLPLVLGNEKDHVATRIAYKLGLTGPALTVQTACSTSLVAVHLAYQSLLRGECDVALAGGACIQLPQASGYLYDRHGIGSPDGHCRAFDVNARGTVAGNGVALVALKPLAAAVADGDTIHAVIRGSAINNDGDRKAGYTAPSSAGQAAVIRSAMRSAGITADTVGYVEAHGTGTELGDGIEIAALTEAFQHDTAETGYCAIGSAKPNLGHLDAAAGITGLIKAICAVRDGVIPPTINCDEPNPEMRWETTPFYVTGVVRQWPQSDGPRRAGVSSFGMGGTNAHVIVEQPPTSVVPSSSELPEIVVVSGHTPAAARQRSEQLADFLYGTPAAALHDVAFTTQVGRKALTWRVAAAGADANRIATTLRTAKPQPVPRSATVVFLLPGQGSQHVGMARALAAAFPTFSQHLDHCVELAQPHLDVDLRSLLFGQSTPDRDETLTRTSIAQPALFAVEYALARQLSAWGITPRLLLGHSLGEYVAACLSGAMSLTDALTLVTKRGRLMESAPTGAMMVAFASAATIAKHLAGGTELAAINAPEVTVIAGTFAGIDSLQERLAGAGITAKRLRVSHAFHSALMEPVLGDFQRKAAEVSYGRPRVKVLSNLTGDFMSTTDGFSADYLVRHLRQPVQFSSAVNRALESSRPIFIEVGPGQALSTLVHQHEASSAATVVSAMPAANAAEDAPLVLLQAVAAAWTAGVNVDWDAVNADRPGRRIPLPPYPFQRRRYWLDAPTQTKGTRPQQADSEPSAELSTVDSPNPTAPAPVTMETIWHRLLGVNAVRDDNFFDLGGHSLLSVRLIAAIRKDFNVSLGLGDILGAPTLGQQIDLVTAATRQPSSV